MEVKVGYKTTAVGVFPDDWEVQQLSAIADVRDGTHESPKYVKQGVTFVTSKNIVNGAIDFTDVTFISMQDAENCNKRSRVDKGDILMSMIGTIGNCVLIDFEPEFCIKNVALIKPAKVEARFMIQLLFSQFYQKYLIEKLAGGIQKFISLSVLRQLDVPLPSTQPEQRAIATALSDVDTLINSLERLIAKKRDLKQAAMQELLSGKRRLPGFSGEWEECTLSEIGMFAKGKGIRKDELVVEGVPCIRYGEIYTTHNYFIREFGSFISREIASTSQRMKKGDLLFAGSGETAEEIGKCVAFLGDEEAYAGGDVVILSPIGQDSMFFGYLLNSPAVVEQKARMGQGDAVVHISARNLGQVRFQKPSVDEQRAIARVIHDIDAEIAALEQKRDKTMALKQGMMQELLTGRIRLV